MDIFQRNIKRLAIKKRLWKSVFSSEKLAFIPLFDSRKTGFFSRLFVSLKFYINIYLHTHI